MAAAVSMIPSDDVFASKLSDSVLEECVPGVRFEATSLVARGGGDRAAPAEADAEAGGRAQPNGGSIGHPVICSRPCLYFSLGQCANGDSCGFCHMPHPKRAPHLDKQHRAKLQNMAPDMQRAWLLAIIKMKVMALDASEATRSLLEDLTWSCGAAGVRLPEPTGMARADRMLWAAMSSLALRVLLFHLNKNLEELQTSPRFDVESIIKHCQALVSARD